MRAVYCLFPGVGAPNALLERSNAALDLPGDERVTKLHSRSGVVSRRHLPGDALLIGGKALERRYDNDCPGPIDADQRDLLLGEPGQDIERKRSAAIEHNDTRRKLRIGFEEPVGFLLLRIMSEAVSDYEGAGFDPKRDAMASKN